MKVKQLIAELEKWDPENEVHLEDPEFMSVDPVSEVVRTPKGKLVIR